jgi:hypothetical protein
MLNRDILVNLLAGHRFQPVRMVSIDDTWSAMWFKPGRERIGPRP